MAMWTYLPLLRVTSHRPFLPRAFQYLQLPAMQVD